MNKRYTSLKKNGIINTIGRCTSLFKPGSQTPDQLQPVLIGIVKKGSSN